jgi:predicted SpoU family rRNA methylase
LEYLDNWVKENDGLINERQLKVEHVINHGGTKVEMGVSNVITKNGGSFELLEDGTCDVMIIDYETGESFFFDTIYLKNIPELKGALNSFIAVPKYHPFSLLY